MAHEAACLVARDGVLVPSRDARRKLRRDGDGTGIAAGPRALLAQQRDASPQLGKRLPSRDPPVAETRRTRDRLGAVAADIERYPATRRGGATRYRVSQDGPD